MRHEATVLWSTFSPRAKHRKEILADKPPVVPTHVGNPSFEPRRSTRMYMPPGNGRAGACAVTAASHAMELQPPYEGYQPVAILWHRRLAGGFHGQERCFRTAFFPFTTGCYASGSIVTVRLLDWNCSA